MRGLSNVSLAVLAAKEEMRKQFWEDHVKLRIRGKIVVMELEKLLEKIGHKYPNCNVTIIQHKDGTVGFGDPDGKPITVDENGEIITL